MTTTNSLHQGAQLPYLTSTDGHLHLLDGSVVHNASRYLHGKVTLPHRRGCYQASTRKLFDVVVLPAPAQDPLQYDVFLFATANVTIHGNRVDLRLWGMKRQGGKPNEYNIGMWSRV